MHCDDWSLFSNASTFFPTFLIKEDYFSVEFLSVAYWFFKFLKVTHCVSDDRPARIVGAVQYKTTIAVIHSLQERNSTFSNTKVLSFF